VLEFSPVQGYDPFFATDFSYQDLGFVLLGGGGEKLTGLNPATVKQSTNSKTIPSTILITPR
jgi:hypothetical protein